MTKGSDIMPFYRVMDRAWMRDKHGTVYHGEALTVLMLFNVKKGKNRTTEQEQELEKILNKER